ncbi:hypothetical protein D3C83_286130 [compost metagenome]
MMCLFRWRDCTVPFGFRIAMRDSYRCPRRLRPVAGSAVRAAFPMRLGFGNAPRRGTERKRFVLIASIVAM